MFTQKCLIVFQGVLSKMKVVRHHFLEKVKRPVREFVSLMFRMSTGIAVLLLWVITAVLTFAISPFDWLPKPKDLDQLLGNLLTAQAAIAALTLAVTLFMMQGVNNKPDADERTYHEFTRRTQMGLTFWVSICAVGITGAALVLGTLVGDAAAAENVVPDLRNLTLVASGAFTINLLMIGFLFWRVTDLSNPAQWRNLRLRLNRRDVDAAVQDFVRRTQNGETPRLWETQNGSADEAIQSLLNDARRAMVERRLEEFAYSLETVEDLVQNAAEQLKDGVKGWTTERPQSQWPPMRELTRHLPLFREEVFREGRREHVETLLGLDYWFASTGAREGNAALLNAGLKGHRSNYQVWLRTGGEGFEDLLLDRVWWPAEHLLTDVGTENLFTYAMEIVLHQELILGDAMHAGHFDHFQRMHKGFEESLQIIGTRWSLRNSGSHGSAELYNRLRQEYRIVLMGLAGRATYIARHERIEDVGPYLIQARETYDRLEKLVEDVPHALARADRSGTTGWLEWERERMNPVRITRISPERYPLSFIAVRLMELSSDTMPVLNLRGSAQRVLDWFTANSEGLEHFAESRPQEPTIEERRVLCAKALQEAVRQDKVDSDYEIIRRELSTKRIADFKSNVYAAFKAENPVGRVFELEGAYSHLTSATMNGPRECCFELLPWKGFFAVDPEGDGITYGSLDDEGVGRRLSEDVEETLCEALGGAPQFPSLTDTPGELLEAIDKAKADLDPSGQLTIVLAGDWSYIESALAQGNPEGFEPSWRVPENEQLGEIGRYHGHPVIACRTFRERRLYVLEVGKWGCLVRAQCESDEDLRIEIHPTSEAKARELLSKYPNIFGDEPDMASRLRKLQTCVELVVAFRHEFQITDPYRARRVVDVISQP